MLGLFKTNDVEDIHIKILRYALNNPGFVVIDLCRFFELTEEQKIFLLSQLNRKEFFEQVGTINAREGDINSSAYLAKYMLSFEGRSRLLEYDELKEARENSHKAHITAMYALGLSATGVLIQIFC